MIQAIKGVLSKRTLAIGSLVLVGGWALFQAGKQDANMSQSQADSMIAAANAANHKGEAIPSGDIMTVSSGQLSAQTIIGGTVIPARDVTLTAQLAGQIEFIGGREGDNFTNNTVLVGINDDELQARRQAAMAQLQIAQADINNTQVQYQREMLSPKSRTLSRSGGMGIPMAFDQMFTAPLMNSFSGIGGDTVLDRNADLFDAGTMLNQAQGRFRQIQSQISEIDARIADSQVNTPFPGTILERMVETGDSIQQGTPLLRYADLSQLQVEAQVPASIVARLAQDMVIPVRLGGSEYENNARVSHIFPAANAQRRTVTVKFDLPNNTPAIPGMYVELLLPGDNTGQLAMPVIPLTAVMFNGSLPTVRVLDGQNQVRLRMIRLGERMTDNKVAVISGLNIGERILSRP